MRGATRSGISGGVVARTIGQAAVGGAGAALWHARTDSVLVVISHCGYAVFAERAKRWLTSPRGGRTVNRAAGTTFVFFGAVLAISKR
jgi:threonine/homoserine/homoserine lactone efflux protein